MLELPNIPYRMAKNKSQVISMRGINYSNVFSDGDMADSKNISARAYPYITTREAREDIDDLSGATAVTVFMGDFAYVKGTTLYWRDKEWTVLPGAKNFATINSKLVIMPDKVYLDGETMALYPMGAVVKGYNATFTGNSVTLKDEIHTVASGFGAVFTNEEITYGNISKTVGRMSVEQKKVLYKASENDKRVFFKRYGYGSCRELNPICKIGSAGFSQREIDVYEKDGTIFHRHRLYIYLNDYSDEEINALLHHPNKIYLVFGNSLVNDNLSSFVYNKDNKTLSNDVITTLGSGYPFVSSVDFYIDDTDVDFSNASTNGYVYLNTPGYMYPLDGFYKVVGTTSKSIIVDFDEGDLKYMGSVVSMEIVKPGWSDVFLQSDELTTDACILFEGTGQGEMKEYTVKSVEENSIYFEEEVTEEIVDKIVNINLKTTPRMTKKFREGDIVFLTESTEEGNNKAFEITAVDYYTLTTTDNVFVEHTDTGFVTIERRIPDMDFICENNNRIWGCSNKDNTIYASALGDPTNFFDYSGKSTDSYAVAVGSPEAFTGCCRYGGDVLFFKEMKIHKIIGSYPAEYYLCSYDLEGVQKGCSKSLQVVGEILYYKGIHGIFAFNGSPSLISANLGEKKFFGAVSGNDGDTLYMSMTDGERDYLFAFETKYGMLTLEDDTRAFDFVRIGGSLYMLRDDGKFCRFGAGDSDTGIEWHIQFTPFYETVSGLKSYSRIVLRLELPQGSYIAFDVRMDGGAWREVGRVVGKRDGIVPVMIPINRCDKFEIKLRGKGKATIHSMTREFFLGGDKA